MLKRRLIPALFIKNGMIVRSQGFDYHQNVGNVVNEAERYNQWEVDELLYIDISREPFYDLRRDDLRVKSASSIADIIRQIARVCFMPLTFGGGIRTLEDVQLRVRNGADKVVINTAAFETPDLIGRTAAKFGSQCVVVSVDYRMVDGSARVFTHFGKKDQGVAVVEWVREAEARGAGEIFLNAIDRDGQGEGYDVETIGQVVDAVKIPVIACGGAGQDFHFVDLAKQTDVSAFAAGNVFHFTERSYPRIKNVLRKHGIHVR